MNDKTDIIDDILNSKDNSNNNINNNKSNLKDSKNEEEELIEEEIMPDDYDDDNNENIENTNNIKTKNSIKTEKEEKKVYKNNKPDGIQVEVSDKVKNTEIIPEDEINSLINNSQELDNEKIIVNIGHESKDVVDSNKKENNNELNEIEEQHKKELINELMEKENLLQLLIKSNSELTSKIEYSNKKYEDIVNKIEKQEKEKNDILSQIKQMEKEIKGYNSENEKYKKMIEKIKSKIELKENLEKDSNIKIMLKKEKDKNKELKNKLSSIKNINMAQLKYINDYDKENHVSEKIELFKNEIIQVKNSIKENQEKFLKLEKFNNAIHEKIISIELIMKKMKEKKPHIEEKTFTPEELHDTCDIISNLKNQINEKRNDLNNICKTNKEKIYKILSQNKTVELEIKDNLRVNKLLIFQRNELRRIIKTMINKK